MCVLDVDSVEVPYACKTKKTGLMHNGAVLLVLVILSGCAEMMDSLSEVASVSVCSGCDWIVQEWDNPGWSTHNSDPYDTETLCEQELEKQSKKSRDRGHRCIYEGDLRHEEVSNGKPADFCHGCDWVVEIAENNFWARTEATTYHTEGVCQQALWHQSKITPDRKYRCTNLDL
jgi:hypothetical protein